MKKVTKNYVKYKPVRLKSFYLVLSSFVQLHLFPLLIYFPSFHLTLCNERLLGWRSLEAQKEGVSDGGQVDGSEVCCW